MPQGYDSDDIDDILSSIMQKRVPNQRTQSLPVIPGRPYKTAISAATPKPAATAPLQPSRSPAPHPKSHTISANKPVTKKSRYKKRLLVVPVAIIMIASVAFFARPIAAFIVPGTPFPRELIENTEYPLLYPSRLPAGYSIDTATINQSDDKATNYAIKNKDGNPVHFSLQQQPNELNLLPLFETMSNVKSLDIPAGTTTIGVTKDKMVTAHTLTGSIWIIARTPVDGGLDSSDLETMLKSLKAAE